MRSKKLTAHCLLRTAHFSLYAKICILNIYLSETVWKESQQFLREVKTEMKKVSWPTRKDTINSTSVVLITILLIAIFLGLIDLGLSKIIGLLLTLVQVG